MTSAKSQRRIYLGEQLVDDGVTNTGSTIRRTTLFEDGIQFIKDDDVQITLVTLLFVLRRAVLIDATKDLQVNHLFLGIGEQLSNILFRSTDKLAENFGTVDDLGLPRVQHFSNLTRNKSLSRSRRTVK